MWIRNGRVLVFGKWEYDEFELSLGMMENSPIKGKRMKVGTVVKIGRNVWKVIEVG